MADPSYTAKVTHAQNAYKRTLYKEKLMKLHDERRGGKFPPFSIEPVPGERSRLASPMTDEVRALRKQWVLDQKLAPHEPVHVPELKPLNPIRRMYRAPADFLFLKALKPILGSQAAMFRYFAPKFGMGLFALYAACYHLKYNSSDWELSKGWHMSISRPPMLPTDENYPNAVHKRPDQFYDKKFSKTGTSLI
ncbi:uncharacterized protein LOC135486398 [Lineus longissimus]|uniref:uncharacterized protein LOC135486398 n=1 Tax=Lineus longissimus TaxID=88925 RepID=UPI00315C5E2E